MFSEGSVLTVQSSDEREARVDVLRRCCDIWLGRSHESSDARFACRVLQAILQQVEPSHQTLIPSGQISTTDLCSASLFEVPIATTVNNGATPYIEEEYFHLEQGSGFDENSSFDSLLAGSESYNWVTTFLLHCLLGSRLILVENSIAQLRQNEWMGI